LSEGDSPLPLGIQMWAALPLPLHSWQCPSGGGQTESQQRCTTEWKCSNKVRFCMSRSQRQIFFHLATLW